MQGTRILPDLQCSLLCEEIRQETNGNFFLIGIISFLVVPKVPVVANKLALFNRWTAGVGRFVQSVRIIGPDQTTLLDKNELKFELKEAVMNATTMTVFSRMEFKTAGVYYVEVLVDDVMKLRYPVPVVVAPQNQNPNPPFPPQTAEPPSAG